MIHISSGNKFDERYGHKAWPMRKFMIPKLVNLHFSMVLLSSIKTKYVLNLAQYPELKTMAMDSLLAKNSVKKI